MAELNIEQISLKYAPEHIRQMYLHDKRGDALIKQI
jgi:hypothetical protein